METLYYCKDCNILLDEVTGEPHYGVNKTRYNKPFQSVCRQCGKKRRLQRKTNLVIQRKLSGCSTCGYRKNLAALDLHHIDESKKEYTIG
jgi:rubredoxin